MLLLLHLYRHFYRQTFIPHDNPYKGYFVAFSYKEYLWNLKKKGMKKKRLKFNIVANGKMTNCNGPCSVQSHFGVIWYACDFHENTVSEHYFLDLWSLKFKNKILKYNIIVE